VADKCSIVKEVLIYGAISHLNLYNSGSLYMTGNVQQVCKPWTVGH